MQVARDVHFSEQSLWPLDYIYGRVGIWRRLRKQRCKDRELDDSHVLRVFVVQLLTNAFEMRMLNLRDCALVASRCFSQVLKRHPKQLRNVVVKLTSEQWQRGVRSADSGLPDFASKDIVMSFQVIAAAVVLGSVAMAHQSGKIAHHMMTTLATQGERIINTAERMTNTSERLAMALAHQSDRLATTGERIASVAETIDINVNLKHD